MPKKNKFKSIKIKQEATIESNKIDNLLLHKAVFNKDMILIEELISDKKITLNNCDDNGNTPFHIAIEVGNYEIIKKLLDYRDKTFLNIKNKNGDTPFHFAIKKGNIEIIKIILNIKDKTFLNIKNKNGDTPLNIAVNEGNVEIIEELLKYDETNINLTAKNNKTISENCNNGSNNQDAIKKLFNECKVKRFLKQKEFSKIYEQDSEGNTVLHYLASLTDYFNAAKNLLTKATDNLNIKNKEGDTPFHIAVKCRNYEFIKLSLELQKIDFNVINNEGKTVKNLINDLDTENKKKFEQLFKTIINRQFIEKVLEDSIDIDTKDNDGNTALRLAIEMKNIEVVNSLISRKADINLFNNNGNTPLHLALRKSTVLTKILLQQKNIDKCFVNNFGDTPLHQLFSINLSTNLFIERIKLLLSYSDAQNCLYIANKKGYVPLQIALLLEKDIAIITELLNFCDKNKISDRRDNDGNTLLHLAIKCPFKNDKVDNYAIIEKLFEYCEDINAKNIHGNTPLHLIINKNPKEFGIKKANHEEIIIKIAKFLIAKDSDINCQNEDGNTPLHLAIEKGDLKIIKFLLANEKIDTSIINNEGDNPFLLALKKGNEEIIKLISPLNINFQDQDGNNLLHLAAEKGDIVLINLLLSLKINPNVPNKEGNTALHLISKSKIIDVMTTQDNLLDIPFDTKSLIERRNKFNDERIQKVKLISEIVESLVSNGANINAQNKLGDTPLHLAVRNRNIEIIEQLSSDKNISANIQNKQGNTPVHDAAIMEDLIIDILINHNIDFSIVNNCGWTPFQYSLLGYYPTTINKLFQKSEEIIKNNIFQKDSFGKTLLEVTINKNKYEVFSKLIKFLPDINAKFINGDTLLHYAVKLGNIEMVETLLRSPGIDIKIRNDDNQIVTDLITQNKIFVRNSVKEKLFEIFLNYSLSSSDPELFDINLLNDNDNDNNNDNNIYCGDYTDYYGSYVEYYD